MSLGDISMDDYLKINASIPSATPATAVSDSFNTLRCHDCGRQYGDAHGFPDLCVSAATWNEIACDGANLLCPSCICKRAHDAGVDARAEFRSGPFRVLTDGPVIDTPRLEEAIAKDHAASLARLTCFISDNLDDVGAKWAGLSSVDAAIDWIGRLRKKALSVAPAAQAVPQDVLAWARIEKCEDDQSRDLRSDIEQRRLNVATFILSLADTAQPATPEPAEKCGAWGVCDQPIGHNMGNPDLPEYHRPLAKTPEPAPQQPASEAEILNWETWAYKRPIADMERCYLVGSDTIRAAVKLMRRPAAPALEAEVARLKAEANAARLVREAADREIERLTKERDEARSELILVTGANEARSAVKAVLDQAGVAKVVKHLHAGDDEMHEMHEAHATIMERVGLLVKERDAALAAAKHVIALYDGDCHFNTETNDSHSSAMEDMRAALAAKPPEAAEPVTPAPLGDCSAPDFNGHVPTANQDPTVCAVCGKHYKWWTIVPCEGKPPAAPQPASAARELPAAPVLGAISVADYLKIANVGALNLYHVQDSDYPKHVLARDYGEAVRFWEAHHRREMGVPEDEEVESPRGVALVAESDDIVFDGIGKPRPVCGHSACSQNFIDTGDTSCVEDFATEDETRG